MKHSVVLTGIKVEADLSAVRSRIQEIPVDPKLVRSYHSGSHLNMKD